MKKWIKNHYKQMIACGMCVLIMASTMIFGAFAEQETDESYAGVTLSQSDIPFLTMEFQVEQDTANYGVYRVPLWLAEYRRYEFIIAQGDSYRVRFEGDTDGYFVSPYGLNFEWRYTNREELSRTSTTITYRYTQSLRLSGQNGYIVTKNAQGEDVVREGNFALEWNVMYVTVEHDKATKYENVMQIAPYRQDYYINGEYLYQRAPLKAVQLYYNDVLSSTTNFIDTLAFDFFLPTNAQGAWDGQSDTDLDFRFTPLLDMINFNSIDLEPTIFPTNVSSAWHFTYLKNVMESVFIPYFDQGYAEGEIIGYGNGYNAGSTDGYVSGYNVGYSEGERDGIVIGWDSGYTQGHTAGVATAQQGTIGNLFSTIVSSIYGVFSDFLNFEIGWGEHFTLNVLAFVGFIVALLWCVVVVRVIIKFFL